MSSKHSAPQGDVTAKLQSLFETPELHPIAFDLDADLIWMIPMTEAAYAASSFLDDRVARPTRQELRLKLSELVEYRRRLQPERRPMHFVFHIGHCGSTLISRLLDALDGIFALREPPTVMAAAELARSNAGAGVDDITNLIFSLASRTFQPGHTAVVKPTSHANNLAAAMMNWHEANRAVFLYVGLETYLAAMLRPHTRNETRLYMADFRLDDFNSISGTEPESAGGLGDAQQAALSWLVHMHELAVLQSAAGERVVPVDFDDYLNTPAEHLESFAALFGQPTEPASLRALLESETANRYSKDPGTRYSRSDREAMLATSRTEFGTEIAEGLRWARSIAARSPALETVLQKFHG